MNKKIIDNKLDTQEVTRHYRFHPTDYWHEIGCPHQEWTKEDLLSALIIKKKFEEAKLAGETLTSQ